MCLILSKLILLSRTDLNYTTPGPNRYYYVTDHKLVDAQIEEFGVNPEKNIPFQALVLDYDHKVKNVILHYATVNSLTSHPGSNLKTLQDCNTNDESVNNVVPKNFNSVEMKPSNDSEPSAYQKIYEARIPDIQRNVTIWFFVTSSDVKGNTESSRLKNCDVHPGDVKNLPKDFNNIHIETTISNLDMNNRIAKTGIEVLSYYINSSLFDSETTAKLAGNSNVGFAQATAKENIIIPVDNLDNNRIRDNFETQLARR